MEISRILTTIAVVCLLSMAVHAGEKLYNGIVLPDEWPPNYGELTREPMRIPYLENLPEVINIDVGRQLFVDDFLIEETTLKRTFHHPVCYEGNPVIKPDREWENHGPSSFAGPFSGGVWYDPEDKLFKMWYTGGYIKYSCYATSKDGMNWDKSELDVVPGTNIVIEHGKDPGFAPSDSRWEEAGDPNDLRYLTLAQFADELPAGIWEIALPNGTYDLFISCGDPEHTNQINTLDVEGVVVDDEDGQDFFDKYNLTATVSDGRLTIQMAVRGYNKNAKICFIEISQDGQDVVKINFQREGAEVPEGYLPDTGLVFGDRGNGFSYGWDHDVTDGTRKRSIEEGEEEQWPLDTTSVWIDYGNKDPERRFKIFYTLDPDAWRLFYKYSSDGIHWSENSVATSDPVGDHTNVHYNPFRNKWVINIRYDGDEAGRARAYVEHDDPAQAVKMANRNRGGKIVAWLGADRLDPHNPNPHRAEIEPQLYHFDTVAYESLMLGYFSIWQGPTNQECRDKHIQKRNEVMLGYSRDGFHYDRPDRRPVFRATEKPGAWNWGNVQSASGACIVVGDKLYLYFTGRDLPEKGKMWDGFVNTGLAFLRRDGFASMESIREEGTLMTRPLQFSGKQLFVNTDCEQGELRVEVLDKNGKVVEPFTKDNCVPIMVDKTLQRVEWKEAKDISSLAGKPIRFRFHLRLGELYSFWVSPDESGASYGYVGAGGPGFTGPRDSVGSTAY